MSAMRWQASSPASRYAAPGIEIRLYGADPDHAEAQARELGHVVLAGSMDKPHGLRECHIVGPGGYIFVPSRAI
jgi:hypothetical protein